MRLSCSVPMLALLLGGLPAPGAAPLEGVIQPLRQVEVTAPVSARITELRVKEGDRVKEGQVLAILYGRLEELEMQRAKALLERREFEAKGARRLYDNRIIPESKALETRIDLDLARLQYETAAEQVRLRTLVSPLEGIVVFRAWEAGETASSGTPMFRILDLSRVRVVCWAPPEALVDCLPGARMRVSVGEVTLPGEVVLVDPCADAQGRIRIKVEVDNTAGRLRSGLKALVEPQPRPEG